MTTKPYPSMSKKEFVAHCQSNGLKGDLCDLNTNRPHLCYSGTYGSHKGEWEVLYRPDLWDEVNLRYLPPWKVTVAFGYLSGYNCAYHQNSLEECLQTLVTGIPMKRSHFREFDRHYVYNACLLAASKGVYCGAFGNACDRSNKGEYKSDFYQKIAITYGEEADRLGESACWSLYANSEHYPY